MSNLSMVKTWKQQWCGKLALVLVVVLLTGYGWVEAGERDTRANEIIQRYMKMPYPGEDWNEARIARLEVLAELKEMPAEGAASLGKAISELSDINRRKELAGMLGDHFHTKESAVILCKLLKDGDAGIRRQAIHGLRMMARRTDRFGGKRTRRMRDATERTDKEKNLRKTLHDRTNRKARQKDRAGGDGSLPEVDFTAKVDGLVPHLIAAASDEAEDNRVSALYALADTRDPTAVVEIRNRLKDPSEKVRFYAACFLSEYQDASGLGEMRQGLIRLADADSVQVELEFIYYIQVEMLLASFERITGKSFGPIPLNPALCSDGREIERIKNRFKELLGAWCQWWAWEPEVEEQQLANIKNGQEYPWYSWGWPWWWYGVNSVSNISWETELPPGESVAFEYDYYYYYRY